ncbi:cyclin N-terminal domain-containing protein 2 isoform X2 [Engraulis encrasicolus]|uniref:cyclin N-terminal domain-containing protein 2 isoform X2 n=1 Tax=Engraulis encrasicolus TaxID=184585 RepID=UPI002FD734C1
MGRLAVKRPSTSTPCRFYCAKCHHEFSLVTVSSHMLMPGLLKHELEVAMVSLGVIHDRTYAWDIFKDMLWTQRQHTFPSAELPKPYSGKMLAILIDWLIQVHAVLDFAEETLHLTVFLLNRAVRLLKVPVCSLQLLGVVCLFLASKKEECLIPEVSELCHLMENAYTKGQLLKMERKVLCILKFELSYTSPHHFLLLLTTIARCSVKMVWMARYLLELTLIEGECVVYQPVHLAGAAIQLARCVLQEPPLTYIGNSIFLGSEASLLAIMKTLALAAARAPMGNTHATFLKYASEETMCVSKHPALICAVGLLKLPGMQS